MRTTRLVTGLVLRAWRNDLRNLTGHSSAQYALTVGGGFLLLLAWEVFGYVALAKADLTSADVGRSLVSVAGPLTMGVVAVQVLLVTLYSPPRSAVDNLLATLPVRRGARRAAASLPAVLLGIVGAVVLLSPLLFSVSAAAAGPARIAAAVLVLVSYVLAAAFGVSAAQVLLSWALTTVLRLPFLLARVLSTVLCAIGTAIFTFSQVSITPGDRTAVAQLLGAPLEAAVLGTRSAGWLLALPLVAMATVGLFQLGSGLPQHGEESTSFRFLTRWHSRRSGITGLVGIELRQWLRYPMNTGTVALQLCLAALIAVAAGREVSLLWPGGSLLYFLAVATLGVSSYGVTRRCHWSYAVLCHRPRAWVLPKLASVFLACTAVAATAGLLFAATTAWTFTFLLAYAPQMLLACMLSALIGLLYPVTSEQGMGNALAEVMAVTAVSVMLIGGDHLGMFASYGRSLAIAAVGLLVLGALYHRLAASRDRDVVAT